MSFFPEITAGAFQTRKFLVTYYHSFNELPKLEE